eukprot:jgi/Phyca11/21899/fgenesh1_pg.PHYCAscaffold_197_\
MSDTFTTQSSNAPSSSSAGNALGDVPASATASSLQGGGDGTAVSPGGSSSAPAQAPASPRDTVADTPRASDIRQGKHVSDSYGGPSCLVGYQYLSRVDADELERIIPGFTEDDILRPRSMATNPRDLDVSLGSITAQGFLKIMASAHRRLREQVETQGATAMIDAAAAQSRCDELAPLSPSDEVEKRLKSEMQDLKTRYQDHIDTLETDKAELKARLTDAEAHIRLLNDRPVTKAIDTWGFAEFLQKNADVSGNWDRLHEPLELYQENATVPSSWDTVINITSLDKRRDPVPDFKEAFEAATAASKVTATEKPPVVLDLTRPGTSSKSGKSPPKLSKASSGKRPQAKSTGKSKLQKRPAPPKAQRRPSRHTPGKDSVRRAGEKTSVPKKSVHTMLPGNVVWKEL